MTCSLLEYFIPLMKLSNLKGKTYKIQDMLRSVKQKMLQGKKSYTFNTVIFKVFQDPIPMALSLSLSLYIYIYIYI